MTAPRSQDRFNSHRGQKQQASEPQSLQGGDHEFSQLHHRRRLPRRSDGPGLRRHEHHRSSRQRKPHPKGALGKDRQGLQRRAQGREGPDSSIWRTKPSRRSCRRCCSPTIPARTCSTAGPAASCRRRTRRASSRTSPPTWRRRADAGARPRSTPSRSTARSSACRSKWARSPSITTRSCSRRPA